MCFVFLTNDCTKSFPSPSNRHHLHCELIQNTKTIYIYKYILMKKTNIRRDEEEDEEEERHR